MRALAILLSAALALGIGSCDKGPSWKKQKYETLDRSRSAGTVELPHSLWEKIETMIPAGEAGSKGSLPSQFASIKVFFVEKNRGILQRGNTEVLFGPGGGEIDLKEIIGERNGSFHFVVEFLPDAEKIERKVYFLSNSLIRKKGTESVGSGCNTYFDVSTSFNKAMAGDGLLLNTTEGRHVSALAGTYFFAAVIEGKLHLASLIIKDSGHPELTCRK